MSFHLKAILLAPYSIPKIYTAYVKASCVIRYNAVILQDDTLFSYNTGYKDCSIISNRY